MTYSLDDVKCLLEHNFESDLVKSTYAIHKINASELLTYTRLDIAFKLLYLEMKNKNVKFSKEIYTQHIRAFSLGKFIEPGNSNKNNIRKFIEEFHNIFEDIKDNGFDSKRTLIPLSKNGTIANGAHRVASAIFLNKDVSCVFIDTYNHIYDYKFFYKRNISTHILDTVTTKFIEYSNNTYIAFIWPIANSKDTQIEKIIPNIVYQKEIELNPNGAHNLLSQLYHGEEWLGSVENNFSGVKGKLVECFNTFEPVKVIAFQAKNLDEVLKIKENVRNIFNMGKHSIHITDTKDEAIRVSKVVFNDNSIHFLNYAKPNKYLSVYDNISTIKKFIKNHKLNVNDIVIDNDIVLSVYGLKESNDIDYLITEDSCNNQLKYHNEKKNELILNPKYYFYFNDLKFISFSQLYKMKTNRAQEKDINDCKMMEDLIEDNKFKSFITQVKQNIFYAQIRFRHKIVQFLQKVGLFEIAKKMYKKLKVKSE